MKKSRFTEEQIAYALRLGGVRDGRCRRMSADGHCRGDVLRLEEEVREPGCGRTATDAPDAGRKRPAKAPGG